MRQWELERMMQEFTQEQELNDWARMLHEIFGLTQNYSQSEYEIFTHLTEVCGAFGKYMFKKRLPEKAEEFLPKIFAWMMALVRKVKGDSANVEEILLAKFPAHCPYCLKNRCTCWKRGDLKKVFPDPKNIRRLHDQHASACHRRLNDFQAMFKRIYQQSWQFPQRQSTTNKAKSVEALRAIYVRLVEELSELAESMRFYHLYPTNFDNELADCLAWWFALVSSMHHVKEGRAVAVLAEDLLWGGYPGYCVVCSSSPCHCRPGPVRELLSKPAPTDKAATDALTQAFNRGRYDSDIKSFAEGRRPLALPAGCVRIDVDDFKQVNEAFTHSAGDEVLRWIVEILHKKVRPQDRVYRVGGDEFAVLCAEMSVQEAGGLMGRVVTALKSAPKSCALPDGNVVDVGVSISVGVAECTDVASLLRRFHEADKACKAAKIRGKGQVALAVEADSVGPSKGKKRGG